jgi:hypothetical protein
VAAKITIDTRKSVRTPPSAAMPAPGLPVHWNSCRQAYRHHVLQLSQ